jgi:hypothetical protein
MAIKSDAQDEDEDGNHEQKQRIRSEADPCLLAGHAPIGCVELGKGSLS